MGKHPRHPWRSKLNRWWKILKDRDDDLKSVFDVWRLTWKSLFQIDVESFGAYTILPKPCHFTRLQSDLETDDNVLLQVDSERVVQSAFLGVYQSESTMFVPILCMKGHFFGVIETPLLARITWFTLHETNLAMSNWKICLKIFSAIGSAYMHRPHALYIYIYIYTI